MDSPYKWSIVSKVFPFQAVVIWMKPMRRHRIPDSKVHGANIGPTWVLSAPDGPHVDPMNIAIRGYIFRGDFICSGAYRGLVQYEYTVLPE